MKFWLIKMEQENTRWFKKSLQGKYNFFKKLSLYLQNKCKHFHPSSRVRYVNQLLSQSQSPCAMLIVILVFMELAPFIYFIWYTVEETEVSILTKLVVLDLLRDYLRSLCSPYRHCTNYSNFVYIQILFHTHQNVTFM